LGGDEFTILLDALSDPSDAMRVAQRLQTRVADPFLVTSHEVRVSLSIGIALSASTHERSEELLKDADVAMRRAKALGGSRCEVFDEGMHTRAVGRLKLESDLRAAMDQSQFRIFYQPVLQLASRRIVSFEALLRWDHPSQGLISPCRFLEAAEDSGILVSIGHWLLLEACRQLHEWQMNSYSEHPVNITVNVSARQFADPGLASDIQNALQQTEIDPSRLQLEMTEHVAAADPKLTVSVLSHLKHLGIGVILDDFGTGTTSLRGLRQFPVDALKIDRSLVREMQADRSASDIVELIAALAHKMNLRAIAEGIESARQVERLLALGCEYGQGYYFTQPLDANAAEQFMLQQAAQTRTKGSEVRECPFTQRLPYPVSGGDHSSIFTSPAEAVEHAPGVERNFADGLLPIPFVAQKRCHHTNYVRTAIDKNDAGVVTHGFQLAGLVRDLEVGGQVARDKGSLIRAQHLKEIGSCLFVQKLAVIDGIEQRHHFAWTGNILPALLRGLQVHHLAAQARVGEAKRVKHGIDILHADSIDEHVRCGIIADGDHHRRQIAQRKPRDAGREPSHDVAVGNQIGRLHGI